MSILSTKSLADIQLKRITYTLTTSKRRYRSFSKTPRVSQLKKVSHIDEKIKTNIENKDAHQQKGIPIKTTTPTPTTTTTTTTATATATTTIPTTSTITINNDNIQEIYLDYPPELAQKKSLANFLFISFMSSRPVQSVFQLFNIDNREYKENDMISKIHSWNQKLLD